MLNNFTTSLEEYKSKVSEYEINEFYTNLRQLLKHSNIFKQDDGEYNIDLKCVTALNHIAEELYDMTDTTNSIFQISSSDYDRLKAMKYIIDNIDAYWDYIYTLPKEAKIEMTKEVSYCSYSGNIKEDIFKFARDIYTDCSIAFTSDIKYKFINSTLSSGEILTIKKNTLKLLKNNYPIYRKNNIESKARIIANSASFLNEYGYMEYYVNANNYRAIELKVPYLIANKRTSKKEKPFTCIEDYYDINTLSLLPDEELSILDLFMVNRVEKVRSKIIKVLMIITFLSNKTKNTIDEDKWININKIPTEELVEAIARYNMLESHLISQRDSIYDEISKSIEYGNNSHLSTRKVNILKGITREFSKDYNNEFNYGINDDDDILAEDLTRLILTDNYQIFYKFKDDLVEILLNSIISANININWGIVHDYEKGLVDDNNRILLSFDLPGYNSPISCHCDINKVLEIIVNLTNDTIIPLYLKDDELRYDYNFTSKRYSTFIPFKLSKVQKECLKNDANATNNGVISHIANMQNVLNTTRLRREENKFIDLLSFTEVSKINPQVKSHKGM